MKRALLAFAFLASACTSNGVDPLPAPPTTKARPSTTTAPDLTGVVLREVPGRVTSTIPLSPGKATINGAVVGPDGPVPGAVVHAERLVGEGAASVDIGTAADGTFALPNILGGRWRIRAYRPPDLALVKPEVFYLEGSETKSFTLKVERYRGAGVSSAIAPNPPIVDDAANLVVQVTLRSVDAKGVVRAVPIPGVRVELFGTGDWRVEGVNTKPTDGAGQALWLVRCRASGVQPLSVLVGDSEPFPLTLPACEAAAPNTTTSSSSSTSTPRPPTTTPPSNSSTSSSSSSTTRPGQGNNR